MAIGPTELKANFEAEAIKFEPQIDALLKAQKFYGTTVSITPPIGMNVSHYQILKEKYLDMGWGDLSWRDDQLDGTTITFYTHNQSAALSCGSF